jgi:hypothetical protein
MRIVIGAIIILIVAFFAVPMAVGGSTNVCQALEKHNVSNTASSVAGGTSGPVYGVINTVGQAGATGNTAAAEENTEHPNTPSPISCAADFWKTL